MFDDFPNGFSKRSLLTYVPPTARRVAASCRTCGKNMQIVHVEPDQRYTNLDFVTYGCDCGEEAGNFIARKE